MEMSKEDRAELQRQADAGEIPNSQSVQMKQALTRLQSRAYALELSLKLYQNAPPPNDQFLITARGIHSFLNEED